MKRPGYCTLCEEPVFKFAEGKPFLPLEMAWRVDFLLSDNTAGSITFCDDCLTDITDNMDKIWEICLERFDFEERGRTPSPEKDAIIAHLKDQHLVKELSRIPWQEDPEYADRK